jgi:hypothetical protein
MNIIMAEKKHLEAEVSMKISQGCNKFEAPGED